MEDQELGWKHGQRIYSSRFGYWRDHKDDVCHFRQTPVAHTGKRHPYCWYRSMRHIGSRRIREDHIEQGFCFRQKYIPDPWDDIVRHVQRSWKEHRKTQYKPR